MIGLFLAQILMSYNVSALPVSLGGMVDDFGVPPTDVSTAIVTYGLVVAALVMVGAKIGQRVGWIIVFRVVVAMFAVSAITMIISPPIGWVIFAQALAGASAAIIVPSLVALIAENYRGTQQATAIGSLGSARAARGCQRVPHRWNARDPGRLAASVHRRADPRRRGLHPELLAALR